MRHDTFLALLILAVLWIALGINYRSRWNYYGYGSGGLFLLLLIALLVFGVL